MTARFELAYDHLQLLEGGLKLHTVPGDRGGRTFGGISTKGYPNWPGWKIIDEKGQTDGRLPAMVRDFYEENYWNPLKCGALENHEIGTELFTFGVVAGKRAAAKLLQIVVGAQPDGVMGTKTIAAVHQMERQSPGLFLANYKLARIARYAKIVSRDKSQLKFLVGWINRSLT